MGRQRAGVNKETNRYGGWEGRVLGGVILEEVLKGVPGQTPPKANSETHLWHTRETEGNILELRIGRGMKRTELHRGRS
jgi:hypothetical protein